MRPAVEMLGRSRQEAYDKAMELLHLVGMDGRILQYPESGSQQNEDGAERLMKRSRPRT